MALKDKIMNLVVKHPKLVTLGIGLAITFVVGTAIGMLNHDATASFGGSHSSGGSH